MVDDLTEPVGIGVFERHFGAIHRFVKRRIGRELADDLASETFSVAFRSRGRFDLDRDDAAPWLYGIAANLLRDHHRSERRRLLAYARSGIDPLLDEGFDAVDARLDTNAEGPAVARALARLAPGDRETLLLYAWADLTYRQIAEALISRSARCVRDCHERVGRSARSSSRATPPTPISGRTHMKEAPMDDLDLVKRFRGGVPEPGPEIIRSARSAMTAEHPAEGMTAMRRPRRPVRWRVGIGVAAAAVAIAVALPAILPGGGPGGAEPAAAATLHRFARIAARQPAGPAPHAGQYVYTRSSWVNLRFRFYAMGDDGGETFSVIRPISRQAWIGVDGSGRLLETAGSASFPTPADEAARKAAGSPDLGEGETNDDMFPAGPNGLKFVDLSGLPTDPDALRDAIESRQVEDGPPGDAETFVIIGDLLRETYGSPALQAALYEVAASLPGVELVGKKTDASGRTGIAVAYENDTARNELIFDPRTAALLGESSIALNGDSGVPAGTILSSAVYLASGVVDSTDETP